MLNDIPHASSLPKQRLPWQLALALGALGFGCSGTEDPAASQVTAAGGGDTTATGANATSAGAPNATSGPMTSSAAGHGFRRVKDHVARAAARGN